MIALIHPSMLDEYWPVIEPYIIKASERGGSDLTIDEIKEACRHDYRAGILEQDGKVVGGIVFQIYAERLHIVSLAGELRAGWCNEMEEDIDLLAAELGRSIISLSGRPGWERKLRQFGYRANKDVLEKKL